MTTDYNKQQQGETDEQYTRRRERVQLNRLSGSELVERNRLLEINRLAEIEASDLVGTVIDVGDKFVIIEFNTGRRNKPNQQGRVTLYKSNIYEFYPKPLSTQQLKSGFAYDTPKRFDAEKIVTDLKGRLVCLWDSAIPALEAQTWILVIDKKE